MFSAFKEFLKIVRDSFYYLLLPIKKLVFSFLKKKGNSSDLKTKELEDLKDLVKKSEAILNQEAGDGKNKTDSKALSVKIQDNNQDKSENTVSVEPPDKTSDSNKQSQKTPPPKKRKNKYSAIFFKVVIIFFIIVASSLVYFLWDLPDYKALSDYEPPLTTRIYSTDGYVISELAKEKRSFIALSDVPQVVIDAFISAEDKSFYQHFGFDISGLARSFYNNLQYLFGKSANFSGASTITQQVAKTFLLSNERTIKRKLREAVLTMKIENAFTKNHILELYLNEIYLGRGAYGVASAAQSYFAKPIGDLTLAEAAYLAAIPKAPSRYDPRFNYDRAKTRRDYVLNRLWEDGKITKEQRDKAIEEPIESHERTDLKTVKSDYAAEEVRRTLMSMFGYDSLYNGGLIVKTTINYSYQEYAYTALRNGIMLYDTSNGYRGPIARLYTADSDENLLQLNKIELSGKPKWYNILRTHPEVLAIKETLHPWNIVIATNVTKTDVSIGYLDGSTGNINLSNKNNWAKSPTAKTKILTDFSNIIQVGDILLVENIEGDILLRQIPDINGAIVVMDPQSGDILSIQGGFSFLLSQFNRATQANRQPGSAFKPFVYLAAIQNGFTPSDLFLDAPYVASNRDTDAWKPRNYLSTYNGYITLRYALEFSKNLATIRIANAAGLEAISDVSKNLGIYSDDVSNLSEVLGSKETTLLKMVTAYSSLVNGGKRVEANLINLVQDKSGKVIYKRDNRYCIDCSDVQWQNQSPPQLEDLREQILDSKDAFIIVNILQGVVERGSARSAKISGYNLAGKTGTTNDVKDAWFVGFSPDLVVGVYIGADSPRSLGSTLSGSALALPVFSQFMSNALKDKESLPFRTPEGIVMSWVNYKTGEQSSQGPGSILESFKEDNLPSNREEAFSMEFPNIEGSEDDIFY